MYEEVNCLMKWTRQAKAIILIVLVLLLLLCAFVVLRILSKSNSSVERFPEAAPRPEETTVEAPAQSSLNAKAVEAPQKEEELYQSPVDFQMLQEANPDIYAWLDIPGTDISYPLLQRGGDDAFYLTHDAEGNENQNGSLFTEETYNDISFADPVTVVYGHHMRNGLMFGRLQEYYSNAEDLAKYNEIIIYLPDRELHFEVFAAVPYDNRHILYNYDFTDNRTFRLFFDSILSVREIEASFAEDAIVQSDEQVLILSTCLIGNGTKRFLVCTKLVEHE